MKIYTKTGDTGETSLYRGGRVPKDAPRLEAYGTLDELNSLLGLARAHLPELGPTHAQLAKVQTDLFHLGAELATAGGDKPRWHVVAQDVRDLEGWIDAMEVDLPPLTNFILPGGHPAGATLHVARTVARRAERAIIQVQREAPALEPLIIEYINRLSDYLFVLARSVNHRLGQPEAPLVP
ncbi:MAG: Cob(I)yrinic acid a,c-diamide adenosyltransferase [Cyanobacteria bacterium RYN_339]|nr:Cob(I)yrinic acid a,c-diamide adenosyltransferase [Cyanobacteria bacterium RYN_339]